MLTPKPLNSPNQLSADLTPWLQTKVLVHLHDPEVIVFNNVFTSQECDTLIDLIQTRLTRSFVFDNATGTSIVDPVRTSQGAFFHRKENTLVDMLDERLARLCKWPHSHTEQMQFLQYNVNEHYVPHYDFFHVDQPGSEATLAHAGNRVATIIVYLHEPEEGGSTYFPDLKLRVNPVKGSAVFFSYDRAHVDTKTLHAGEPVIKGTKCIATKWFRERQFQQV